MCAKPIPDAFREFELRSCTATAPDKARFNAKCMLPYGLTVDHIRKAMTEFTEFLGFVNVQLNQKQIPRLETMLMPANFSSMVGEFITANIPKYCPTLVKNRYHNGHPDMLPKGIYAGDAAQHETAGIEVKASRYPRGWQGHNPEDVWLMVFVFASGRPNDEQKGVRPAPFRFDAVYCAQIVKADWQYAGRSATSRRTITATVKPSGFAKMSANWVYRFSGESSASDAPRRDEGNKARRRR